MDKKTSLWERIRPSRRRLIQLYAALLYNAQIKGYIEGEIYTGKSKYLCVPGLNCYSCPGAIGACPLGALQNALASTGNRAPWYVLGILTLFGITLGRTICGFLCPFGLIQELLHKIPTPKLKKNAVTRVLSWVKYVLLLVLVIIVPLWYAAQKYPVPAFCKYICPAGTLEGAIGLLSNPVNAEKFSMLNILFTRKFVILVLILSACIFVYRAFCRFLCPLGALYGLFAKFNIVGVKVNESKCTHCGRCVGHCQMDIRHVGDHECIHCGGCIDVCPTSAISLQAGKLTLRASAMEEAPRADKLRKNRRIAWIAALVALAMVLVVANVPTAADAPVSSSPVSSAPPDARTVGAEVGNLAADFTIPVYGGEDFTLSQHRGQVVVLNFWATWCTPCVAELPYFQQLHEAYPDIVILAIHSDLITDDVEEYLAAQPYTMPFAQDDGSVIAGLNGSTMLPQTAVIDPNGVIVYNKVGSVTYELLESLVQPLLEE